MWKASWRVVWAVSYCTLHTVRYSILGLRQKLTETRALTNDHESSELRVYLTGDGVEVYEDTFMKIAKPDGVTFKPTLILVGTRLGLDKITPVYWEALKSSLQMPQSIGIAGYVSYSILAYSKLIFAVDNRHHHITSSEFKVLISSIWTLIRLGRHFHYQQTLKATTKKISTLATPEGFAVFILRKWIQAC